MYTKILLLSLRKFLSVSKFFIKDIVCVLSYRLFHCTVHLRRKYYVVSNKLQVAYIINEKVACSSIKYMLISSSEKLDISAAHLKPAHRLVAEKGCGRKKLIGKENSFFVFTFVRNPFERLVSLYIDKFESDCKIRQYGFLYQHYLGGIITRDMSFDSFVKIIVKIPSALAELHFMSQYYKIFHVAKKQPDFVGKYENLEKDFLVLQQKFKLNDLPKLNPSGVKYNYEDYYTTELVEIVFEKYKKDIEYFGYTDTYEYLKNKFQE